MNKTIFVLGITLLCLSGYVLAEEQGQEAAVTQEKVNVGNKICPVSGEKVGEMGEIIVVEHEGKIYNLCCQMCVRDFQKDPDQYIKKVEEEMEMQKKSDQGSVTE